jgi:hypothetical protein
MAEAIEARLAAGGRRLRIRLAAAAIGAFVMAFPVAAMACVTPQACFGNGGFNSGGFCEFTQAQLQANPSLQSLNNQPLCTNGPPPETIAAKEVAAPIRWLIQRPVVTATIIEILQPNPENTVEFVQRLGEAIENRSLSQSGSHLGMYTSSGAAGDLAAAAGGGGYVIHSNGYGVTDTAGVVAPGTTTGNFRDTGGSGGIAGTYDASRLFGLPGNQQLLLQGLFDYSGDSASLGTSPALAALGVISGGSFHNNTYTFGGSFLYRNDMTYLRGVAAYSFGNGHETQTSDGSTGSFNTKGYFVDARLGNVFVLLNTTRLPNPMAIPTKAPPKPAVGGYIVGLDLSGHLGYSNYRSDGFTDSSGFVYGTDQARAGDVGARAKLFAGIPNNGLLWVPYVGGTVDQLFSVSNSANFPSQATLVGGDVLSLSEAKTFWGAQGGLDVLGTSGWTVGIMGFYTASSDTNIAGGSAYVRVPLNYTPRPTLTTRY